jgi:uncharacterized RDD family membrane protein YckC
LTEKDKNEASEWSFKVEIKPENSPDSQSDLKEEDGNSTPQKNTKKPAPKIKKLVLDTSPLLEKSGFEEFTDKKNLVMKTEVDFAKERADLLQARMFAQIIDLAVGGGLYILTFFELPIAMKISKSFLEVMNWKFIFQTNTTLDLMQLGLYFLNYFIVFAILLSYLNKSIGKNIMGLKLIGKKQDSISVSTAFQREMIFKPISFLTVIGALYPYIDKDGGTLHDFLSGTQVVVGK